MTLILAAMASGNLAGILITFLIAVVVIAVIAGLIYAIETWIIGAPLPPMVKMVIGLVLIVLVIIWAIHAMGGG